MYKVRELEWEDHTTPDTHDGCPMWYGATPSDDDWGYWVDGRCGVITAYTKNNDSLGPFDTLEEAKAACQADYSKRIKSALVPSHTDELLTDEGQEKSVVFGSEDDAVEYIRNAEFAMKITIEPLPSPPVEVSDGTVLEACDILEVIDAALSNTPTPSDPWQDISTVSGQKMLASLICAAENHDGANIHFVDIDQDPIDGCSQADCHVDLVEWLKDQGEDILPSPPVEVKAKQLQEDS